MTDLWTEASEDHEGLAREAALARADAELETVMPFLLAARSSDEFAHRAGLAQDSVRTIAAQCDLDEDELWATARRRYKLYRQALQEGQDPLTEVCQDSQGGGYGSGPEKPDEHDTGPAPSAYSEVPAGPPGGPNPQVTQVRPPMTGPVQEATGSLRRQADMMPSYAPPLPPDTGTGAGSLDTGLPSSSTAGMTPSLPAGGGSAGDNTPAEPAIGQTTSSVSDPVRRRVMAVTAAIKETNPHLPQGECERVARKVVGRYLRQADLASSVVSDDPGGTSPGSPEGGGHSGGNFIEHGLEWQGLKGMMGGGEAAGGAGLIGDAAELAAL